MHQLDRSLKVAIVTRAPFVGGAEVAAERLALGLQGRGHEAMFLLGQEGAVMERFQDHKLRCDVFPMPHTGKANFWQYYQARRAARRWLLAERPDVLHMNDLPSAQLFADAARGLPITRITHHRFIYERTAIDWFNKFGADRQLFVSRALQRMLYERSPSLASQPGEVLYDGLDLPEPRTATDRAQARQGLKLPQDRVIVLFAGQVIEAKGVADLLTAWSSLSAEQRGAAVLYIVGEDMQHDGNYRQHMQQFATQIGVPAQFMGFRRDVPIWLRAADLAVVPSHVEPLGNATLEAMSHGLPVIGANVGGIPEMIEHNRTGLLVEAHRPRELSQALASLITNRHKREALGRSARQRCEAHFSLDIHIDHVLRIYREMLVRHTSRRQAA